METETKTPQIHAVQMLARVIFTDGKIGGMMLPPAELDPTSSTSNVDQATRLMDGQAGTIRDFLGEIGPVQLHEAATDEIKQRRTEVHDRADDAHEANRRRDDKRAEHSNGSGSAE